MIGKRKNREVLQAVLQYQHYRALINMAHVYPECGTNLWRYISGRGDYPYDIKVRTPVGLKSICLYSYHDLLTVNEIFCRLDYPANSRTQFVVDVGSNIGISALYFLTRNSTSQCVLFEPDPKNIVRLRKNLAGFEERYTLVETAVSDESGQLEFGVENTGRYGGLGVATGTSIIVRCLHINEAIKLSLSRLPRIDILKIDTEGVEVQTISALDPFLVQPIEKIYLEASPRKNLWPDTFQNKQYGSVRQLIKHYVQRAI